MKFNYREHPKKLLFVIIVSLLTLYFKWDLYYSLGFNGVVLNAESSEPVEGAIVKAVWRNYRGASYHGSRGYHTLISKEAVTDINGRFKIDGWIELLGEKRFFDKMSPIMVIKHPKYQPYKTYIKRNNSRVPLFGYVSQAPIEYCIPNNDNAYYLDSNEKGRKVVSYSSLEINGKVYNSKNRPIEDMTVSIEWGASSTSCTNSTYSTIAEYSTKTDSNGAFQIPVMNFGELKPGYKIRNDMPKVSIECQTSKSFFNSITFRNKKIIYGRPAGSYYQASNYYQPGNIEINLVDDYGNKTNNELHFPYETCL